MMTMYATERIAYGQKYKKEVCPSIGLLLIKRVLYNFTPDEFCPDADVVPGCDQKHEDIDPDALHKSFVLRIVDAKVKSRHRPKLNNVKAMEATVAAKYFITPR
ncbi:hypothetical protein GIB67_037055 [Kingdonia uniflora]|uniref:Uncharacterized protein n=1 Tax=Kingdonia uniflora TaxID=39325 RepID=A0A7J7LHM5_9MAGN|nr:hypothetical protein GIB67_037055 [Kingdonia uniflora]